MRIFETDPTTNIIHIIAIIACSCFIYFMISHAKRVDRFNVLFRKYIQENHKEIEILKEFGPVSLVSCNNKKYKLDTRKCYPYYKKDPDRFEDIIEAYLFELTFVEKISIETESGNNEIPKMFK
jgi:hypothetical protein